MESTHEPENPWQTHETHTIYDNPWIKVTESQVTNPSGGPGIYGVVHYKHVATGVIPIDDEGHTWLVGQYRYPTNTYEWEIPEGGASPGEPPLEGVKRELAEEAGLRAEKWELILKMHLSNCVSNEVAYLYVARDLSPAERNPDETEKLAVKRLPLEEVFAMLDRGEITDAMSVAALWKLRWMLKEEDQA